MATARRGRRLPPYLWGVLALCAVAVAAVLRLHGTEQARAASGGGGTDGAAPPWLHQTSSVHQNTSLESEGPCADWRDRMTPSSIPLATCADIAALPRSGDAGCGCVYCETLTAWHGRPAVIRTRSTKAGCDPKHAVRQFHNQVEFANARLFSHPAVITVLGVCTDRASPAVLVERFDGVRLHQLDRAAPPNVSRVGIALRILRLLAFLAEPSADRPGSPYLICNLRPRLFGVDATGAVKLLDVDHLLPLEPGDHYRPFPPKLGVLRAAGQRLFGGHGCTAGAPCPLHCVPAPGALSEGACPGDNATCPGLGPKTMLVAFGDAFLRELVAPPLPPRVAALLVAVTQREENLRPAFGAAVAALCRAAEEERAATAKPAAAPPSPTGSSVSDGRTPDPEFMGCEEITKLPVHRRLGCGCVSCAFASTWQNRTVVIKKLSNKAGRCDRRHSINLFRNQATWGVQRINHPSLLRFHGVCRGLAADLPTDAPGDPAEGTQAEHRDKNKQEKEGTTVVVEYVPGGSIYLPKLTREPMLRKLRLTLNLAELLQWLSAEKSPARPGSPYIMCDFKAMQFVAVGDTIKLVDVDMVVPMEQHKAYHVLPPKIKNQHSWINGRIFVGYRCKLNTICPMECLFGYKKDMSEYMCAPASDEETKQGYGRCPGVGTKATTYMFASNFLRGFLETHELRPELAGLVTRSTSYWEAERPEMSEMVTSLRAILAAEEANPSQPIDYGVELADDSVYDTFLQPEDVRNLSLGERLNCSCIACDFRVQWRNQSLVLRRQRKDTKGCPMEDGNYLSNTGEIANLRIVHQLFLTLYGSTSSPRHMIVLEDVAGYTPLRLDDPALSFAFQLKTLLRISYLVKYLSVLAVDRPGSPYLLCDLALDRFLLSPHCVPKMVHLGAIIPISLSLKCQAWPPKVGRNPIYMHGRVWFQRHCDQPGQAVCEHAGCLRHWKGNMSEFLCQADGRCPGAGVQANVFLFGHMLGDVARRFPAHAPLQALVRNLTEYEEGRRPTIDHAILALAALVKEAEVAEQDK
eukprot:EG_transcript_1383